MLALELLQLLKLRQLACDWWRSMVAVALGKQQQLASMWLLLSDSPVILVVWCGCAARHAMLLSSAYNKSAINTCALRTRALWIGLGRMRSCYDG